MDYDGTNHPQSWKKGAKDKNKDWSGEYDDWDDSAQGVELYEGFIRLAIEHAIRPDAAWYCWHASRRQAMLEGVWGQFGAFVHQQIIWAKDRLVLSRGDYHWQHEPCWYAVKKTGKGHWAGDRKQTTLWHISGKDQDAATVHGTQKPVECMRRPILNNSSPGQAVFEPFMGSGTTLIAAETTGRVCFGVELNPAYVDVAIERWQQFTGANAVLVDTGETFADLKAKRLAA